LSGLPGSAACRTVRTFQWHYRYRRWRRPGER